MKILHLVDEPWDSGLTHYALVLAAGQRSEGHDVGVWVRSGTPAFEQAEELELKPFPLDRPVARLRELRAELNRRGFEVLNAHTGRTHTLAAFLAGGSGPAVVRTRGDSRPPKPRPGSGWLYRRTAGLIVTNRPILEEMERLFKVPPAREVIHQGLDADSKFRPTPAPAAPVAGILGRLDPVKGHEDFLQALARSRPANKRLEGWIAGPDANLTLDGIRRRAVDLGLGRAIRLVGRSDDPAEFMRSCRFGVIASRGSEAVSRVALEWMASGRAVAATRVGALPEVIEDGETGLLVPPSDPQALSEAISRLAAEPGLAERMGAAARRRLEERYSLREFVGATSRLYSKALQGRKAGRAS